MIKLQKMSFGSSRIFLFIICFIFLGTIGTIHGDIISFDSDQWQIVNGKIVDHLGRKAFKGAAYLKDLEFENGIIKFDVAVNGKRSYPGVNFRIQSRKDYERFYIRPHRAGLYPDALQYTPSINGISEWQLCNGDGYTSSIVLKKNEWIHVRMEILNKRAKIYINDNPEPALEINDLKHGISRGTLGVMGPMDGSAYFTNFEYKKTENLVFSDPPVADHPIGMIIHWELSKSYKVPEIELDKIPEKQGIKNINWRKIEADSNGLVDIGKYTGRSGRTPDAVFARTSLYSQKKKILELKFGYSDAITVFLNGTPLFFGNSSYQSRDRSFLGIIGLNDTIFLPLNKGENELIVMVAEGFGGWGFMFQDANSTYFGEGITKTWETDRIFKTSESVLYDPKRDVLYVTNFDQFNIRNPQVKQYISKLSINGKIIEEHWVDGLNNPLGMIIHKDMLYVAERKNVAVIDIKSGEITKRLPVKGSVFLNDIAIDKKGTIYISDSRKNVIWRSNGKRFEEWLTKPEILDPNVLYLQGDNLLIGNSGDEQLKSVNIKNKSIKVIARFPKGFIDGIRPDGNGNLLVSLWKGKLYKVRMNGRTELILHTFNKGLYSADFEYIPKKNLLIIPTFFKNNLIAYTLDKMN